MPRADLLRDGLDGSFFFFFHHELKLMKSKNIFMYNIINFIISNEALNS